MVNLSRWYFLGFSLKRLVRNGVVILMAIIVFGYWTHKSAYVKIEPDTVPSYILEHIPKTADSDDQQLTHVWHRNAALDTFSLAPGSAPTYWRSSSQLPQDAKVFEAVRDSTVAATYDGLTTYVKYPDGVNVFQVKILTQPGCGIHAKPRGKKGAQSPAAPVTSNDCPQTQAGTTYVSLPRVGERVCLTAPPAKALIVTSSVRPYFVVNFDLEVLLSRQELPATLVEGAVPPTDLFRFIETTKWQPGEWLPTAAVSSVKWDQMLSAWKDDKTYTFKAFPLQLFDRETFGDKFLGELKRRQGHFKDINTANLGGMMCFGRDPKASDPS
jgi:hypothetical protein